MFIKLHFLLLLFLLLLTNISFSTCQEEFIFNGFTDANLTLDGISSITSNGLLRLTNDSKNAKGHSFYPSPFNFHNYSSGKIFSFSTTFVFGIISGFPDLNGHGIAFTIFSNMYDLSTTFANQYLGIFNKTNNGNSTDHIFAVELDTIYSPDFEDIDDNHVGIDINNLKSSNSSPAGYFPDGADHFKNLSLTSHRAMQIWIDYDGLEMRLDVTLSPLGVSKPKKPLLSSIVDLRRVLLNSMYVGFSSSTGDVRTDHFILGWSFNLNGVAQELDLSKLPSLPNSNSTKSNLVKTKSIPIWMIIALCLVGFIIVTLISICVWKRVNKYAEILEDWEIEFGPHRFSYKDLYIATNGFREEELLGSGGFGRVYRGVLPRLKMEVAVKKVSHDSKQGMKEFISEIASLGRLRHRNIVPLLGYCRRKGELFLVYDFMPNGSLDKYLYDLNKPSLGWDERFRIIKGVGSGLLYLHEEWEQVVIHRDIKANNVLLDFELNAKLGDFGLARLYDHGTDPHTTHVVGTMGYLDPELARTGRASTVSDVFAFGAFILEVTCGKRPIEQNLRGERLILFDWVLDNWEKGSIFYSLDQRLRENFSFEEVNLVLRLGLLCMNPVPILRPSMSQVMKYLKMENDFPQICPNYLRGNSGFGLVEFEGLLEYRGLSYPSVSTPSTVN